MERILDWNDAALNLRRDVCQHGGFLTIQRDALRERFNIGRLTQGISNDLVDKLSEHRMVVIPHPYSAQGNTPSAQGNTLRVYDLDSEIGKIARAVAEPQTVSEKALLDTLELHTRANAGKDRRSDDVPWLTALDVFLQLFIGRPPEGWEDLDDQREPHQLVAALAEGLGLPAEIVNARATAAIAGAVCAYRPRRFRLEAASPDLNSALEEAGRRQQEIFDRLLREAAKHLLGRSEIPSHNVELGRLGLRYRREAQGGMGWLR